MVRAGPPRALSFGATVSFSSAAACAHLKVTAGLVDGEVSYLWYAIGFYELPGAPDLSYRSKSRSLSISFGFHLGPLNQGNLLQLSIIKLMRS